MRDLGEIVLGLDQEIRVGDEGTYRGRRYRCVKFIRRPPHNPPLQLPPNDLEHWEEVLNFAKLAALMSGQFGIRLQSTGDAANLAETRLLMETVGASPTNPYLVTFDQLILDPFTNSGRFDLVERDASDEYISLLGCITEVDSPFLASNEDIFSAEMVGKIVACPGVPSGTRVLSYQNTRQVTLSANATILHPGPGTECIIGGESQVTIATKDGFTDGDTTGGWSRLMKAITVDKIYSVIFVPGDAGDGIYSMRARGISQDQF